MPTAGAGVSVETGARVKVTENMADRVAPAVGTSALMLTLVGCDFTGILGANDDAITDASVLVDDRPAPVINLNVNEVGR